MLCSASSSALLLFTTGCTQNKCLGKISRAEGALVLVLNSGLAPCFGGLPNSSKYPVAHLI